MPTTIFESAARDTLVQRLGVLTPQSPGRWGKMNAPQMLSHLIEACRMAFGELPVRPRPSFLSVPIVARLVVRWLPWPKGAPTAPELVARSPEDWEADIHTLVTLIRRFAQRSPGDAWPPHPAFGALSGEDWGVLVYRHIDHHLQQFGI